MNKYQVADELANQLIADIKQSNKLELILRQLIKQAYIEGVKYGTEHKQDND